MSNGKIIAAPQPFKAVFLVGSTGVGRRTAAKILGESDLGCKPVVMDAFHFELRERCHAANKLFDSQRLPAQANAFEATIDEPNPLFGGLSPRVAYSKFARYVNDAMGPEAMGRWVVQRLKFYRALQEERIAPEKRVRSVVIFDDAPTASFQEVVNYIGAGNCTQILIRRDGISSLAVQLPGVRLCEVKNSGDGISAFELAIRKAAPHLFIQLATLEN